jgi:hypothetical protein
MSSSELFISYKPFSAKCKGVPSLMKVTPELSKVKPQLEYLKGAVVALLHLCSPS